MAATDKPEQNVRPETLVHNEVQAFADGKGQILSKTEQETALAGRSSEKGTAHLPNKEDLLEQLRTEAKTFEKDANKKSDTEFLSPQDDYSRTEMVRGIEGQESAYKQEIATVKNYSPEQIKDIDDLVGAAHDPAKLKHIMQRFVDAEKFTDLQDGLQLAMGRKGGDVTLGCGFYTDDQGFRIPTLEVGDTKTGIVNNIEGPKNKPSASQKGSGIQFDMDQDGKPD